MDGLIKLIDFIVKMLNALLNYLGATKTIFDDVAAEAEKEAEEASET